MCSTGPDKEKHEERMREEFSGGVHNLEKTLWMGESAVTGITTQQGTNGPVSVPVFRGRTHAESVSVLTRIVQTDRRRDNALMSRDQGPGQRRGFQCADASTLHFGFEIL
jgi:hypothetical protein